MKHLTFHKEFTLNGKEFSTIRDVLAYSEKISPKAFSFLSQWFDEQQTIEVHTSGSTGTPKSIQLKKEHMFNSALATGDYFKLPAGSAALLCLPIEYIAGKMMLVRALVLGWHLDLIEADSNPIKNIDKTYDFCAMVPLQVYNSIDRLQLIKKLIVGGGAVSKELLQKISTLPTQIFATYGMTETCTHIAVRRLNNLPNVISNDREKSQIYFGLLPNIQISKDERNCLVIQAPHISEKTVITNDIVDIISETDFQWLGRYDNIINSGGIKLIPEQIEQKLSSIIEQRFFVAGLTDDVLGEKLVLVIESKEKDDVILNTVKHLKTLSKFEIPKAVFFIDNFIETSSNKINRQQTLAKLPLS